MSEVPSEIINLENQDLTCSDFKDYPLETTNAVGANLGYLQFAEALTVKEHMIKLIQLTSVMVTSMKNGQNLQK